MNTQTIQVQMTLEQLLEVIRHLDADSRTRVAQVLLEGDLDSEFDRLVERLAHRLPADDISDAMINQEIQSVRRIPR